MTHPNRQEPPEQPRLERGRNLLSLGNRGGAGGCLKHPPHTSIALLFSLPQKTHKEETVCHKKHNFFNEVTSYEPHFYFILYSEIVIHYRETIRGIIVELSINYDKFLSKCF